MTLPGKIINTHIDMSEMRACRILNICKQDTIIKQVLLPCVEFPGFKKITLESGIKSESLKREAAEQQLLYISYERQ